MCHKSEQSHTQVASRSSTSVWWYQDYTVPCAVKPPPGRNELHTDEGAPLLYPCTLTTHADTASSTPARKLFIAPKPGSSWQTECTLAAATHNGD